MPELNLKQIESICEEEGNYIEHLKQEVAHRDDFIDDVNLIKKFRSELSIPDNILNFFTKLGCQVFFEFPQKEEKEHITFFKLAYRSKHSDKILEEECGDYRNLLLDIYKNVLTKDPMASMLLEISYINKASIYLNQFIQDTNINKLTEEILFMKKINGFLKNVREELANNYPVVTSFFETFIEPFPYGHIMNHHIDDFEPLFLSRGYPLVLFLEVHKIIVSNYSQTQLPVITKEMKNKTLLTREDLKKCKFSRFFLPTYEQLKILHKSIIRQAEKSEIELIKTDKNFSLMDQRVSNQTKRLLREKSQEICNIIEGKNKESPLESSYIISELLSEIEKASLDYIWHLKDFLNKSYELNKNIEANYSLRNMTLEELKELLEEETYRTKNNLTRLGIEFLKIKPFLENITPKVEKEIFRMTLNLVNRLDKNNSKNKRNLKESILTYMGMVNKPDVNKILKYYKVTARELLLPLISAGLFQRNIIEWPRTNEIERTPRNQILKEIDYFGIYAIPKGKFYHFSKNGKIQSREEFLTKKTRDKLVNVCKKHFKRVVAVLIYDIRGSSFMTLKLHNAEREQMIIKNFHSTMAKIAKEYGAFLLKDIGDGGIIWFGNNSKELYNSIYRESTTRKFKKLRHSLLSEEGLFLQSSPQSSEKAIECAISMVKAAEKFISDNYVKYRDWFSDIKEKELKIEGTTYALLPPMFRSLFRLGIGIASGIPSKDIAIGPNAFGDPDLRGMLINEAKFLSEGRDPEKSVILADHNTIFNLLLTIPEFTFGNPPSNITKRKDIMSKVAEILKGKLQRGTLNFTKKNFSVEPYEILSLDNLRREKYTPTTFNLDESGTLLDKQGKRVKILYNIIT
jgi:hypothetical protein